MSSLKPPVLVVGNIRSGTTMTQTCFGKIDSLVTWVEPRTVWKIGNAGCDHDELTDEMATPQVIERIRERFLQFQESHGGRRVVDKTPSNIVRVGFIHRVFPESKILHIYRNGLDNVSSALIRWTVKVPIRGPRLRQRLRETPVLEWPRYLPRYLRDVLGMRLGLADRISSYGVVYEGMREDMKQMDLVEVLAKQWVNSVEKGRAQLRQLPSDIWMVIRYEDLVANPVEMFGQVLDFFDLEMSPALEEHLRNDIHEQVVGAYKKRLTPEQIHKVIPIIRPTMESLGYEIEEPQAASANATAQA